MFCKWRFSCNWYTLFQIFENGPYITFWPSLFQAYQTQLFLIGLGFSWLWYYIYFCSCKWRIALAFFCHHSDIFLLLHQRIIFRQTRMIYLFLYCPSYKTKTMAQGLPLNLQTLIPRLPSNKTLKLKARFEILVWETSSADLHCV